MKSMTKPCYKLCINKKYWLDERLYKNARAIIAKLEVKQKCGRPKVDFECALSGIYYVLRTGCQWNALPRCFGSYSAIHRYFKWLTNLRFFEKMWKGEISRYHAIKGLQLDYQIGDCAMTKAPLGGEATGNSPVDRRKLGTKRSIIVEKSGIPIGLAIGPANQNDAKLLIQTIRSIPTDIPMPMHKYMRLDGIYDSSDVRTTLFNTSYTPRISPNNRRRKIKKVYPYNEPPVRWIVERSHSWTNRFRRIFVRWEKRLDHYVSMLQFAFSINTFNKSLI